MRINSDDYKKNETRESESLRDWKTNGNGQRRLEIAKKKGMKAISNAHDMEINQYKGLNWRNT